MHRNNNRSNYRNDPDKNPLTGYSSDTTLNKKKFYAKTEPYLDTKKKRGIYIYIHWVHKKSCPIVYGNSLYKFGQTFSDTQYELTRNTHLRRGICILKVNPPFDECILDIIFSPFLLLFSLYIIPENNGFPNRRRV